MNVGSKNKIVSFHLQCRLMRGPDIYLHDITFQHTIYMVKIILIDRVGLREDQQRIFLLMIILHDYRSLASYNIDNYSIIVVRELPRGGARTRRTAVLRINDISEVYFNTTDECNEDDEGEEGEKRTGECPLCSDISTYGTNCENDNCEDGGFFICND